MDKSVGYSENDFLITGMIIIITHLKLRSAVIATVIMCAGFWIGIITVVGCRTQKLMFKK